MRRLALIVLLPLLAGAVPIMRSGGTGRLVSSETRRSGVAARYVFVAKEDGTWDRSASYRTGALTVTGPATTVDRGDGTAVTVPSNTLAVGPSGALVYGARTSRIHYNQRDSTNNAVGGMLDASWIRRGTAAVAAACATAPDGSCTADDVTLGPIGVDDIRTLVNSGFTANAPLAVSIWIKRVSTSGTVSIRNPYGQQYGRWDVNMAALPDAWQRLTGTHPAVTVSVPFIATATGQAGMQLGTIASNAVAKFWRPWQQEGTLGPDAEVQAAPLSVAATVVRGTSGFLSGGPIAVSLEADGTWGVDRTLWSTGSSGNNRFRAYVTPIGVVGLRTFDYAGGERVWYATPGLQTPGRHRFIFWYSPSGNVRIIQDGVELATSVSGTGTGIISTYSPTIYIGTDGATLSMSGSIRSMTLCNTPDPERCQ